MNDSSSLQQRLPSGKTGETFRRFLGFLRPHWKLGLIGGGIMLVSVGLQLPMPLLTMYLIDHVVADAQVGMLHLIGASLLVFLLLKSVAAYWQSYTLQAFRNRVIFDVRRRLFLHLERLPLSFFGNKRVGYLTSRISGDVTRVQGLLADTLLNAVRHVITLMVGVGLVFWLNWKLALVTVSILPFFVYWIKRLNPKVRRLRRRVQEEYGNVTGDLLETLSNIYLVKSFTAERRELAKMLRSLRGALGTEFQAGMMSTLLTVGAIVLSSLGKLALIWFGCWQIIRGELTLGAFLAFNSFLRYLFEPAEGLVHVNLSAQESLAAVDRILEILDEPSEREGPGPRASRALRGRVEVRDVCFSYDGEVPALSDISFDVQPGTRVAVVGRSGSGKSTLINLLMRLYEPDSGAIYMDGAEIRDIGLNVLRRQISLVPQDTFLFSGTVWDNLRYGRPTASEEELEHCAKLANADDFICRLPRGYDTEIGERGVRLSGGQRQRIAIAMAFVKDAPILVFDEATASMDNISERKIQEAMVRLMEARTTFVVAHRLGTVRNADMIIVLAGGRIVERGDHESLIKGRGPYAELYSKNLAA